jgi:hypothetical protein
MYILIYAIAVGCALIGMALSFMNKDLAMLSAGLLSAVLFGALGKVVHLLDMIHERLEQMPQPASSAVSDKPE